LTVRFPRHARAWCGKLIDIKTQMSNEPSCPVCQRMLKEFDEEPTYWDKRDKG
jgi:transcription initiation factor IIE alpha subunit